MGNIVFKHQTGTNVTIQNNKIYHSEGHGLFLDSGSNMNYPTLLNNIYLDNTLGIKK
jgi:hypothetical protein